MITAAVRRKLFWLLTAAALLLLLAACGQEKTASPAVEKAANGDLREATAAADKLPSFLEGVPNKTKLAYQAAAALRDTLQWIPCYCGCGASAGHRSNADCFIREIRADGTVVWDDHGTRCDVCQTIALRSAQLRSQGKSNMEIRAFIDNAYRTGFAAPTDTPLPA